jgi:branched-chain amino acid transport system permease protein
MVALGLNLVYCARLINIAHGEFLMIGAYVAFWGFELLELSPLIAAILAGLPTGSFGVIHYFALFRRLLANDKRVHSAYLGL